jgi:non-canonical (house-cleaning) NTP pyrophosphatase
MSTAESDAVQSVENLIHALADARAALRAAETALRRALKKVEGGADVATAIVAAQPSETRNTINEALTAVEHSRHEARRMAFAVALDQGMSIGELARAWGFSRQLAARYAKEARAGE